MGFNVCYNHDVKVYQNKCSAFGKQSAKTGL